MEQSRLSKKHGSFTGHLGLARRDITPPIGIYARSWGAARHDVAESIHRPLTLTALTFTARDKTNPLVLLDADLGWWRPLDVYRRFQQRLLSEFGLDSSQLFVALSHTHAAAPLMEPDPTLAGSELLAPWLESVYEAAVDAITTALATPFNGILDWHVGSCHLATNREFPDPQSKTEHILCGFNPGGEADATLLLGRVTDESGTLRATIVNYACHPTTLAWENRAISPDYLGAMRATMEAATGATALFLQGASGDLAPAYQYVGDSAVADRHGEQLAYAALATLCDMEPAGTELCFQNVVESGAPLAVWRHRERSLSDEMRSMESAASLTLKDWPTADELEHQRRDCEDRALEERLRRRRDIRRALGDGSEFAVPVYAWRLGDAILIGCCCEPYSLLQREIRGRFPDRPIACINLLNGSVGYLPPAASYDTDVYPAWQTPFARGGLEKMIATMMDTIEELLQ